MKPGDLVRISQENLMHAGKIALVTGTTQGPEGPTVNMSYHRTEKEGRRAYDECLDSVGADPSTILFVRIDEETMKEGSCATQHPPWYKEP